MMLETLLHVQLALSVISVDHINSIIGLQIIIETQFSPHMLCMYVVKTIG